MTDVGQTARLAINHVGAEEDALRKRVRQLLDEERSAGSYQPSCDAWLVGFDPGLTRRLAAHGWVGMTIPREYGGAGSSMLARHVVLEEFLAQGAPVAAHWIADRQIVPALLRYGSNYLRERYLPGIAAGELYFAVGMSEPDAGSDLTALRTRANSTPGGWMVNGTKVWTSGAHNAHVLCILARTPELDTDRASYTQFFVERPSAGLAIRPILTLDGVHHFNEVVLNEVFVPAERVLGQAGAGWVQVRAELSYERGGPERFLSLFSLVRVLVETVRARIVDEEDRHLTDLLGSLVARLVILRRMSLALAGSVDATGHSSPMIAAVVKDLGTELETDLEEVARRLVLDSRYELGASPVLRALLDEATTRLPGFGIRAGSTEMLRSLIARELGIR